MDQEVEEEEEGPGLAPASTHTCKACGIKATPQWRRGPLGARTQCNACGVKVFKDQRAPPEAALTPASPKTPTKTSVRFWQACAACKRMRNVPKHVHDEVSNPHPLK